MLSKALGGVTVLQKGAEDLIATNTTGASKSEALEISKIPKDEPLDEENLTKVDAPGGLKRCGGQGDVLSGCVGTWLAWGKCYETGAFGFVPSYICAHFTDLSLHRDKSIPASELPHLAAIAGSLVTRTTSRLAFQKMGRGLVTQDMLSEIGGAFADEFGEGEKGWGGKL